MEMQKKKNFPAQKTFFPFLFLSCCFLLFAFSCLSQPRTIDRIVAVVGNGPILESEVQAKVLQSKLDSVQYDRCMALEELLYQKLLFAQALKDSVEVTDEQVDGELERRLRYYIAQFGSVQAFEDFYGKSIDKFKEEFRDDLKEILLVQRMQENITGQVTVSPIEVKDFFSRIPPDSIPRINAEVEVGHIVKKPKVHPELKKYAKEKLESIRQEIISGKKDFATAAILYSEDPGSPSKGGLYENVQRGTFVAEFDAVAFRMKENEVSEVFETEYGYHILRVDAKRGEEIDVRHILIKPQPSPEDMNQAKLFLDSIASLVKSDSISITEAASRFSDDEETRMNGGLITNPYSKTTRFEMNELSQIDPGLVFIIDKLSPGVPSQPMPTQTRDGSNAYHIVYVKSRTEPHLANLKDDYQRIQDEALLEKKEKIINRWIQKKIASSFVRIADDYKNCKFENNWVQ